MTEAPAIIDFLSSKVWTKGAYAWFTEVNAATGGLSCRRADALVVSCWPSRGIYAFGVEVKVDRQDWLKELRDPSKSAPIQRFCRHWWVATTPGIVRSEELPETWGLIEVDNLKRSKVVARAPKLEPEKPTWEFFASVFRNASESIDAKANRIRYEAKSESRQQLDELQAKLFEYERHHAAFEHMRSERDHAIKQLGEFSERTGINPNAFGEQRRLERVLKLASTLENLDSSYNAETIHRIARKLLKAAELMRTLNLEGGK
jgi:hypothetical protein